MPHGRLHERGLHSQLFCELLQKDGLSLFCQRLPYTGFKSHPTTLLTMGARRKFQDKKEGFVDNLPILDDFLFAWKVKAWEIFCLAVWISLKHDYTANGCRKSCYSPLQVDQWRPKLQNMFCLNMR